MKKTLILCTLLCCISAFAAEKDNKQSMRPDKSPSKLTRFVFSLEGKIIEQSGKVEEIEEEWQRTPSSEKKGIWPFQYRVKEKLREKLDVEREELKDLLASTPTDANQTKAQIVADSYGVASSNTEALEIKLSIENLINVVRQGRRDLRADPTNLEIAGKYYDTHVICLATIIEMAEEFVFNIDDLYRPKITKLINEFELLIDKSDKMRFQDDFSVEQLQQIKKMGVNQRAVHQKLLEARDVLPEQKAWAHDRVQWLEKELKVGKLACSTLDATKEAKSIIAAFGSEYDKISVVPPPLIVFEVDLSEFDLPRPNGQ